MMLVARLLDSPVGTAEMDPRAPGEALYPEEESAVARAVPARRREFIAGRTCARRAMRAIGEPPAALPQGEDRCPVWPAGLVGTITHTGTWCAAAVVRSADGFRALGVDIETASPLRADLLSTVCLPQELEELGASPCERRALFGKLVFSAKESAFKCQYALSRTLLDFHAMRIVFDWPGDGFTAVFQRDAAPFARGDTLRGRALIDQGYIATAIALPWRATGTGTRSELAAA
jgi:4'-phosphopantetheinyl transferase EntD